MEQNITPQNIHDVDKTLKQSTVNRVKLLKQPLNLDIKMPKSIQSDVSKQKYEKCFCRRILNIAYNKFV